MIYYLYDLISLFSHLLNPLTSESFSEVEVEKMIENGVSKGFRQQSTCWGSRDQESVEYGSLLTGYYGCRRHISPSLDYQETLHITNKCNVIYFLLPIFRGVDPSCQSNESPPSQTTAPNTLNSSKAPTPTGSSSSASGA